MGYMDTFLANKLGYQPSQDNKTNFWNNLFEQSSGDSQVAKQSLMEQTINSEFTPTDSGETGSFDSDTAMYQPPVPNEPTPELGFFEKTEQDNPGFYKGMMAAGSALMQNKGFGGAIDAMSGRMDDVQATEAKTKQQEFQNQMATDKFGFQQDESVRQQGNTDRAFDYKVGRDDTTDNQWQADVDYREGRADVKDNQWTLDYAEKQAARRQKARLAHEKLNNPNAAKFSRVPMTVVDKNGKSTGKQVFTSDAPGVMVDARGNQVAIEDGQRLVKDYAPRDRSNPLVFKNSQDNVGIQFDYDPMQRESFATIDGVKTSFSEYLAQNPQAREATSKEIGMDKQSLAKLYKHEDEIVEQEKGLKQLGSYRNIIAETPDGGERYFKRALGSLQTLVGQGHSVDEVTKMIKEGDNRAMSLVGLLREDVVGGGVMTEQDALKVLMAMGGDPTNITWNKGVAGRMINDLYDQRSVDVRRRTENYNVLRGHRGLDPYKSSYDLKGKQFNKPKAPAIEVGTVDGGYEFLGGDPADQNNWRKN